MEISTPIPTSSVSKICKISFTNAPFSLHCEAYVSATSTPPKPHVQNGSERADNDNNKTCLSSSLALPT